MKVIENLEEENDEGRKAVDLVHKLQQVHTKQIGIATNKIRNLMTDTLYMQGVLTFRSNAMRLARMLNDETEKIRRIAEKAKMKKISMDLLSSKDLRKHTNYIKKMEKTLTPIFMGKEVQNYFTLDLVTAIFKRNKMYVFTRIPLVDFREKHVIEPFVMKGSHNLEYLVLNAKKNTYRKLSNEDLDRTLKTKGIFVSDLRKMEISNQNVSCGLKGCEIHDPTIWVHESNHNTFSYAFLDAGNWTAEVTCHVKDKIRRFQTNMPRAGFITLPHICSLKTEKLKIETMEMKGSGRIDNKKWKAFKIEPFATNKVEDKQMAELEDLQIQAKNISAEITEARAEWKEAGERTKEEMNELKRLSDHVDMAIGASLGLIAIAVVVILVVLCKAWRTICY